MATADTAADLMNALENEGFKGKILDVGHVDDLKRAIDAHYQQGAFDEEFFAEELGVFDYSAAKSLRGARSLIVVAAPQLPVRVTFKSAERNIAALIPPTYSYATDRRIEDLLGMQLEPAGYQARKAVLPYKLLAVHSGLARYGKNNITYVDGMGSFYRLAAYVSDLPGTGDTWGQLQFLDECRQCAACTGACPTGAIGSDRFLLHAERCITFHNERQGDFPVWLNPSWHHCLVGCMVCQKVCPVNQRFRQPAVEGPVFSEAETAMMLQGKSGKRRSSQGDHKLEALDMLEYADILGRNLNALNRKRAS